MHQGQLWAVLPQETSLQFCDPTTLDRVQVNGIAYDSRQVKPRDLFVAIPGTRLDGLHYVADAVRKGAAAVVAENTAPSALVLQEAGPCIPVAAVPRTRLALALLAHAFHGQPSSALDVIGITGTNGKTTTAKMVQSILAEAGRFPAFLGTVGYQVGGRLLPAPTTTPQSADLARLFREAVREGHDAVVMEVSSHALDQDRVTGTNFRVAAFTNLTRDHQDYHVDMESYYRAKLRLFEGLSSRADVVVNVADRTGRRIEAFARCRGNRVLTCGSPGADVGAEKTSSGLTGSTFRLCTPTGCAGVHIRLPGMFNVANAVTAAGIAVAMGVDLDAVASGLERLEAVPGRMERIPVPDSEAMVVVDYAHTHVALENVLRTLTDLRKSTESGKGFNGRKENRFRGRLIVLFGCGGDRDQGRRSRMGKVAAKFADRIIVTSDNPRNENPEAIIQDILQGVREGIPGHRDFRRKVQVEADRRLAIRKAVAEAGPRDILLIAGKGHEATQIFKDVTIPFDDREEVLTAIQTRYNPIC